jgi:hypothetical protein
MKRLLMTAALLLGLAVHASAQTATPPQAACKLDSVAAAHVGMVGTDFYAYWYCPASSTFGWVGLKAAAVTPDRVAAANLWAIGLNPSFVDQAREVSGDDPSMAALKCAVLTHVAQDLLRTPPACATPQWVVGKNASFSDRPSFAVVDGKRSLSSKTRATVGAPCDCAALKFTEGSSTYCQVAPATVAICTKASP